MNRNDKLDILVEGNENDYVVAEYRTYIQLPNMNKNDKSLFVMFSRMDYCVRTFSIHDLAWWMFWENRRIKKEDF